MGVHDVEIFAHSIHVNVLGNDYLQLARGLPGMNTFSVKKLIPPHQSSHDNVYANEVYVIDITLAVGVTK